MGKRLNLKNLYLVTDAVVQFDLEFDSRLEAFITFKRESNVMSAGFGVGLERLIRHVIHNAISGHVIPAKAGIQRGP